MNKAPEDRPTGDTPAGDKLAGDKPVRVPARPDRTAREAAALRANLLKRKDQARRREEATPKRDQ